MQAASDNYFDALHGFFRLVVQVDAWRGGRLVSADLPVSAGQLTVTDGQAIRSRLSLAVSDSDGEYTPRSMTDALAPFGSELNVKLGLKVGPLIEMFSLGWFVIQSAEIDESYGTYSRPDEPGRVFRTVRGATIQVEAADRALLVADDRFLNREQPPTGTSVLAEIGRLLSARVPYAGTIGTVADKSIPAKFTYDDDRLKAVADLADLVDADPIFTPQGSAAIAPRSDGPVVWSIPDGTDGFRVSMSRSLQRDGVYNAVVARGQTPDNETLQQVATLNGGPLLFGGAFGRVPYFFSSPVLETQGAVDAAAATTLARISKVKPQKVQVVCVINPALECGDMVKIPVSDGVLTGRVVEITYPLSQGATTMTLGVAVDPLALVLPE